MLLPRLGECFQIGSPCPHLLFSWLAVFIQFPQKSQRNRFTSKGNSLCLAIQKSPSKLWWSIKETKASLFCKGNQGISILHSLWAYLPASSLCYSSLGLFFNQGVCKCCATLNPPSIIYSEEEGLRCYPVHLCPWRKVRGIPALSTASSQLLHNFLLKTKLGELWQGTWAASILTSNSPVGLFFPAGVLAQGEDLMGKASPQGNSQQDPTGDGLRDNDQFDFYRTPAHNHLLLPHIFLI